MPLAGWLIFNGRNRRISHNIVLGCNLHHGPCGRSKETFQLWQPKHENVLCEIRHRCVSWTRRHRAFIAGHKLQKLLASSNYSLARKCVDIVRSLIYNTIVWGSPIAVTGKVCHKNFSDRSLGPRHQEGLPVLPFPIKHLPSLRISVLLSVAREYIENGFTEARWISVATSPFSST